MSHGGLEHEITGCPGCDAEKHQEAVKERENQQREDSSVSAGLVLVGSLVALVVVGLWAGAMTLLKSIT